MDLLNFDKVVGKYTEEELENMLDTGIELLGMIRDGDPNTDDSEARAIYQELFG
jgi:hypothetical protein